MGIYRQKHSPYWYGKVSVNGRTWHKSTGQTVRRKALDVLAEWRTALLRGQEIEENRQGEALKLATFLNQDFLPYIAKRFEKTTNTRDYYFYGASPLLKDLGFLPLPLITDKHAREFEAKHIDWQATTVNRSLRTLRRALNLAEEWGKLDRAPRIRLCKGENVRDRVLTAKEAAEYLKSCRQPWKDAALVLLYEGMRPEEVRRMEWQHIKWRKGGGVIEVQRGKTAAARRPLVMVPEVYAALKARHGDQGKPRSGWVFPSAKNPATHWGEGSQKTWHIAALKRSGVEPFPPYSLRHTCLSNMANVCDSFTLSRIAGHSSIRTISRYVHPQQDAIERAFEVFSRKTSD